MTYVIVAHKGSVKHVAQWHSSGGGAAAMCRRHNAPRSWAEDGTWLGDTNRLDPHDAVDLPWCRHCASAVAELAADVLAAPPTDQPGEQP